MASKRLGLAMALAVLATTSGTASAGSQCFKNLDKQPLYITLRYASGETVVMRLQPGEKRRFNNVGKGDSYCYSFEEIVGNACPNKNPVHLTSCQNPDLM